MLTHVTLTRQGDVGYLTLACDQEGKPATLDLGVLDELDDRIGEVETSDGGLRAVVVGSNSEKYFAVGANVNALEELSSETMESWVLRGHEVFNRLEDLPLPTIARVAGFALGGGLELAMACDLIAAARGAKLGHPEAKLGFVPGWGATYRLARRVGIGRAREMAFTGRLVEAAEAMQCGLVDLVADPDGLDEGIGAWISSIREGSPVAIAETKKLLAAGLGIERAESGRQEAAASLVCMEKGDTLDRVRAFLASRKKKP